MTSTLLSIIVPTYNLSGYILSALESVDDSFLLSNEVEIIIVNDGSTDNTLSIIQQNMRQGYHLFDMKNGGVSIARNFAIEQAIGKYITFLDGDDLLFDGALPSLLEYIKQGKSPDVIIMRSFTQDKENYPWNRRLVQDREYTSDEVFNKGYARGSVCGCAFKNSFIKTNKLKFIDKLKYGEDTIFFASTLIKKAKYVFKDIYFYNVIVRLTSASRDIEKIDLYNYKIGLDWLLSNRSRQCSKQEEMILDFEIYRLISAFSNNAALKKMSYAKVQDILDTRSLPWLTWRKAPYSKLKMLLLNFSFNIFFRLVGLKVKFNYLINRD